MAALNLFPARVRFVNDDGTLTMEAYRALQIVFNRVGGSLGDVGTDTFTIQSSMGQSTENPSITDMLMQPLSVDVAVPDVMQFPAIDQSFFDITQDSSDAQFSTITTSSTVLAKTSVSLANGAAAALGTLSNAPVAGNPTKWVPINDNGVTRYIPAW